MTDEIMSLRTLVEKVPDADEPVQGRPCLHGHELERPSLL